MAYTTIDKPTDYFNTKLYTGTGNSHAITGVGFQSDWTWVKARSSAFSHYIIDAIRYDSGASKYLKLDSSSTAADETPSGAGWISTLNSDGYVCKNGTSNTNNCNENGVTYVAWNWLASNTTASNTDGSITSSVSANTTSGFSIVTTTGTGANATIGHGLGTAPAMIIGKRRDSGSSNWRVYNKNLSSNSHILFLDTTDAEQGSNSATWNNTAPTSSVFSVGTSGDVNASSGTFVFYCFAEKKGYSKFGSYTGNGNADGTFVYTGFKPAWVMVKATSISGENWQLNDNKRKTFNVNSTSLFPNLSNAESTDGMYIDMLSNGFKARETGNGTNGSGVSYIYMAFASSPFTTSTGIPTTAR